MFINKKIKKIYFLIVHLKKKNLIVYYLIINIFYVYNHNLNYL